MKPYYYKPALDNRARPVRINENSDIYDIYNQYECDHHNTNDNKTKCLDCGMAYDEATMKWVEIK